MTSFDKNFIGHLMTLLNEVQRNFQIAVTSESNTRLADAVDSMTLVEFIGVLAKDCGVSPEAIDLAVGHSYGTIAEVASCLQKAGLSIIRIAPDSIQEDQAASITSFKEDEMGGKILRQEDPKTTKGIYPKSMTQPPTKNVLGWLVSTTARLPEKIQPAPEINEALGRPPGWLEGHAGIRERRIWADQDPVTAAAESARECLSQAKLSTAEIGALLVTSEAPPLLVGLSAALHHRLELSAQTPAIEIGGACTGFLAAWWTATKILSSVHSVLIISVECHSQHLSLSPGPAGEAAALFGDAAAACLICDQSIGESALPIRALAHRTDGSGGKLLRVEHRKAGVYELHMHGVPLAGRAVRAMAQSVRDLVAEEGLKIGDLAGVVSHGGNGRMPALLAMHLGLPPERVWSQTPNTGNLGSASLPVAWAMAPEIPKGPVAWTAVGAGLTWAAALTGEWQ